MKKQLSGRPMLLTASILCTVASAVAQEAAVSDTLCDPQTLKEVVIEAPRVVKKIDRDLYFPSADAKKLSSNGLQLVANLHIPTISVDEVLGSVSSLGNSVQIRINGRVAGIKELRLLDPANIKRFEWIANPGMKYDGAAAVINVITVNPTAGGSLMAQGMTALTTLWIPAYTSLQINNGRSQWGLSVDGKGTDVDGHRDYKETFTYPDGSSLTRRETPLSGKIGENYIDPTLSYSYIKPDTTVVYISLGADLWKNLHNYTGNMKLSDGSPDVVVRDKDKGDRLVPTLSAYLEQHLAHRQVFSIDASASHHDGHSKHLYEERYAEEAAASTEVNTSIHDRNTSFGVTGNYEKEFDRSKITVGMTYTGSKNRATYENLDNSVFHQSQDRFRLFGEYRHRINRVTLWGGFGVQFNSHHLRESDRGRSSWSLRPKVTVKYDPSDASQWYLSFYTWQATPSLSQTNDVAQQIDGFQWHIGNPAIKTYSTYRVDGQYAYGANKFSCTIGFNAELSPDAIAPYYEWRGDKLYSTYENSTGRKYFSAYISPSIDLVPGWCNISGFVRWGITHTEGTGYRLTRRNWSGEVTAALYHWNFQLILQYKRRPVTLVGELETWGEHQSLAALSYSWKNWQFMAGLFCPFNKYDQGSRLLNRYNNYDKHMRINMATMPLIQVSYNVQWGRQKRGVSKRVNADSSVDASKAASR